MSAPAYQNPVPPQQPDNPSFVSAGPVRPPNRYVLSILALFFLFAPTAIPALVNASKVDEAYEDGKYARAEAYSKSATIWLWWTLGIGISFWVFYILIAIISISVGG